MIKDVTKGKEKDVAVHAVKEYKGGTISNQRLNLIPIGNKLKRVYVAVRSNI
jgi:hypothetical protein